MKIWIVLPAFNEADNITYILSGFRQIAEDTYNLDIHILLMNDGSTDNTSEVARAHADSLSLEVYENEHNMGLAETFMRGMILAAQKAQPGEIIICMDADNSQSPGIALRMARNIMEGRDVVIASRYQKGAVVMGVPIFRRILSRGMSILFRMFFPIQGVKDYSCGYRAYRAKFLQQALQTRGKYLFTGEGFSCMAGLLLALSKLGAVCGEVPIVLRYDLKAGASKMNVPWTVWQTLRLLFRARFGRIGN